MSIDGGMDKEILYIYIMEYYSAIKRNGFESFELRWLNPEHVIWSKVRKKKNKYCILLHVCI